MPPTGRRQLVDINQQQDAALGLQSYRQVLAQENVVPAVDVVREVGQRLAAVAEDPGFQWEFNLIASDQANAFCLPGGKVAVYTGILPITANTDGLAVVMGHEIAHAIARHGAERMAHQRLGVLLPFSREHESEADYMGLIYAARACFNPEEAPKVRVRMGESHPPVPACGCRRPSRPARSGAGGSQPLPFGARSGVVAVQTSAALCSSEQAQSASAAEDGGSPTLLRASHAQTQICSPM